MIVDTIDEWKTFLGQQYAFGKDTAFALYSYTLGSMVHDSLELIIRLSMIFCLFLWKALW